MCKQCRVEAGTEAPGVKPYRSRSSPGVDDVVVERLVAGVEVRANSVEMAAAVAQLTGYGMSAVQVAARLRITPRHVQRYRALLRGSS